MKLIIDIPKEEYEEFKKSVTFLQSIGVDFSEMRQYMLAIANGTILEQEPTTRNCFGCKYSKDNHNSGTEECHLCMWENQYTPTTKNDLGVDCIKKSDAINIIQDMHGLARADVISDAVNRIIAMPSITQQEPRKGYWLRRPHVYGVSYCSICDFELKIDNTNYCPNCGAKMESEE